MSNTAGTENFTVTNTAANTIYAAGAVCWRLVEGKIRVLVIHRTQRRDVSLPKGKVDPGEVLPQTAVREVAEETGLSVSLGVPLGITRYTMPNGRDKIVHYWAAEVTESAVQASTFVPNDEVAALEWLPLARAIPALSYERDVEILKRFEALIEEGVTSTFAIITLRHAKATPPFDFDGPDNARPLTTRGVREANEIVPGLASFGPRSIRSSTALRCVQTATPVSIALGLPLKELTVLSQDHFENQDNYESHHNLGRGKGDLRNLVGKRVRKRESTILCSHGPVLPELLREIALATGTTKVSSISRAGDLPVAGYSVIHLSSERPGSGIIAVESHIPS